MTITINKETDKFFLALGKEGKHTFIMFGVYDQNKVSHLLCRVGKDIDEPSQPGENRCMAITGRIANVFFSKIKSRLKNERTSRDNPGNIPISYQAYDTTYEHYLEFIGLLENLQNKHNRYLCYKPRKQEGNRIELTKSSQLIMNTQSVHESIKKNIEEFSIDNTCRHTAIKLVEEVQKVPVSSLVSSNFFTDLPYRTQLVYGKPSMDIPFYVLPMSPDAYPDLNAAQKSIIEKLYARMERLVLLEPASAQTVNKFNSIKTEYTQIVGPQREFNLEQLLQSIQSWKERDKSILNSLRTTYFWDAFFTRTSATMTMINEIEHRLITQNKINSM